MNGDYTGQDWHDGYTSGYKKGFTDGFDARAAYINKARKIDVAAICDQAKNMAMNNISSVFNLSSNSDEWEKCSHMLTPIFEFIRAACTIPELSFDLKEDDHK